MSVGYLYKSVKIMKCAKEMINRADLFVIHETQNILLQGSSDWSFDVQRMNA